MYKQCTNKNNNNVYTSSFKNSFFPRKKKPLFTTQIEIASAILNIPKTTGEPMLSVQL